LSPWTILPAQWQVWFRKSLQTVEV
jgi:hypothetical protein